MEKKTILITGASDGIGKETAKTLAEQGHTVIMHGRNPEKTKKAFEEIKAATGNKGLTYELGDFSSLAGVKVFAEKILSKTDKLDVLINNAGAQFRKRNETVEGHEMTMQVNVLAPFLLTSLLLPALQNSASARVVTVASAAHKMGGEPLLDDLDLKDNFNLTRSYGLSKLYVIWVMRHFVKDCASKGIKNITFNCTHPGSAMTKLARDTSKNPLFAIVGVLWLPMMNSVAKGAWPSIHEATTPELEGVSNKYFGPKGEEKVSDKYWSEENEQKVWDWCIEATKDFR
jgi:NAD(P)-dependent dehydrogenase (short-subunit alcohol dehydrogenase family)